MSKSTNLLSIQVAATFPEKGLYFPLDELDTAKTSGLSIEPVDSHTFALDYKGRVVGYVIPEQCKWLTKCRYVVHEISITSEPYAEYKTADVLVEKQSDFLLRSIKRPLRNKAHVSL